MKTALTAFMALVIGATAGYLLSDDSSAGPAPSPRQEKNVRKSTLSAVARDKEVKILRERVQELERRLREAAEKEETSGDVAVPVAAQEPQRPMGFRERMEKMKQDDPQRYQQMTNRFAQFRLSRARHAASRIEFLSSIDTSGMSASAKRTHEELQEVIAAREALESRLHDADLTDEERRELFTQMRETDGRMRRLNEVERDNLLLETAKGLGFGTADAKEITATIKQVIDATDQSHRMHRPGRR